MASNNNFISADEARTVVKWLEHCINELDVRITRMETTKKELGKIRFKNVYASHTHDITVLRDFVETIKPYAVPSALESIINQMHEVGIPSDTIEQVISDYMSNVGDK